MADMEGLDSPLEAAIIELRLEIEKRLELAKVLGILQDLEQ